MQWFRLISWVLVTIACVSRAAAGGDVTRVELDCGLEVVVFSQEGLEGDVQVWVQMHRGSMSERDDERGAAMMGARAAMFGVGSISEDQMFEMFDLDMDKAIAGESVIVRGGHLAFRLEVGSADEVGVGFGLARALVDSDRQDWPSDRAIELVRDGMVSELESIESEYTRRSMSRVWLPELVDGSGYGRMPLPSLEECVGLGGDTVRGYIAREWTPGQASVLVVGDVDPDAVIAEARRIFAGCQDRAGTARSVVPIIKPGLGGRVVSMNDLRMERSLIGLVWFGDEQERAWDDDGIRDILVLALAGEAMQYRINRLLRGEFDGVNGAGVDVGVLVGRVEYGQMIVEFEGGEDWKSVLRAMEIERFRLVRDGLSEGEIKRATEWLLQQWGYEIDQWGGATARERAQTLSWMLASGRPIVELEEWVGLAKELLVGVDAGQVNAMMRGLIGDVEPAVLVLLDSDVGVVEPAVRSVLAAAGDADPEPLDSHWVDD